MTESVSDRPGWLLSLLLLAGVGLCAVILIPHWEKPQLVQCLAAIGAAAIAAIPSINRRIALALDHLRTPSPKVLVLAQVVITVLGARYFLFTADNQNRLMLPKMHDEHMYAIQAHMLAGGHLWLPQHPLADFFESFYLFVKPVYAPIYFPGAAMLFVPAVWLGVGLFTWATLIAGAIVGLTYRIFTELFDGVAGMLAALLMLAIPMLHLVSMMIMSHAVGLFLSLLLCFTWLRWRHQQRWAWALLGGITAGWLGITRPLDAVCVALPISIAVLLDLRGQTRARWLATACAAIAGAIPFLTVQGVFDHAVTGHVTQSPAALYNQINWPAALPGFQAPDPHFHPPSNLPQFQQFYSSWILPQLQDHANAGFLKTLFLDVLPTAFAAGVANPLVLVLLPLGLIGLSLRRWVLVAALPLFAFAYAVYPFVMPHYMLLIAPALMTLVLGGWQVIRDRSTRAGGIIAAGIIAISLTGLHEINPTVKDPDFTADFLVQAYGKLAEIKEPAIVLFTFDPRQNSHQEPVYNIDTAWPDDAQVIRAHDLGPLNAKLYNYYARIAPNRVVYRYDRGNDELQRLGTVADLARANRPG